MNARFNVSALVPVRECSRSFGGGDVEICGSLLIGLALPEFDGPRPA
jgi:hypothetical protein